MDISIVVPIYNEEENISILSKELEEVLASRNTSYETIFINDGSTDNSLEELKKVRELNKNIKIIDLKRNFGQTPAIMAGFHHAKGATVISMDGDLQNDPKDIPELIAKLNEGNDLVSGWRRKRNDNFFLRILPSKIANWMISKVLKTSLHDYGCTLKAYKHDVIKDMNLYGEMHRFIPAIANWRGAKIAEIEVNHRARQYGKTKYGINRTPKVLLDLLLMGFFSEYSTKPIRFFGGIGLLSSFVGGLTFLAVLYMKLRLNVDMTGNPLLILSVLFFLVSIQLLAMGFLGEINIRTYYESQDKKTYNIREILE